MTVARILSGKNMTISSSRWAALLLVVGLASCGGGEPDIITGVNPIDGPGTYTRELGIDGLRRSFLMYVPASANLSAPVPVVMVLHGNPPTNMQTLTRMNSVADTLGFVAVYPQSWNQEEWAFACIECNRAASQGVDDVKFFRGILQQMRADLNVDGNRVYISGFSQGSLMAFKLGCEMGSEVAGVGVVGGIPWDWHVENCSSPPVHTIWMIGTDDNQFPWAGEPGTIVSQLSAEDFETAMVARNGCQAAPMEEAIEDIDPSDNTTAVEREFQGCSRSFVQWRFDGMDHNWPGSPLVVTGNTNRDVNASGVLGRFFLENPR
jgi:polyhydroxybutyrate depolymerase